MKIDFCKSNGILKVMPEGRLDTTTAPELESFLEENYDGAEALLFDCENLSYLSSAGLRILLVAQKKSGGKMKLINVCELVMDVIQMTGFADILVIE